MTPEPTGPSSRRLLLLLAPFAVAVAVVTAVLMPSSSIAWPWDNDSPDRMVTVYGQVQCEGIDAGSTGRYPFAKVEGFEIRGRSGVMRNPTGTGWGVTYEVEVPVGWTIEWSVKCSNSRRWAEGSFPISKTVVGTSYSQERHICSGASVVGARCIAEEYGNCIELWLTGGWRPQVPRAEDAFALLDQLENGGPTSIEGCAKALRDGLPDLNAQPSPTEIDTKAPLPDPTHEPRDPLEPVPTPSTGEGGGAGGREGGDSGGSSDSEGSGSDDSGSGAGSPAPREIWSTVSNLVTNGATQMREDPSPAYLSTQTVNRCRSNELHAARHRDGERPRSAARVPDVRRPDHERQRR